MSDDLDSLIAAHKSSIASPAAGDSDFDSLIAEHKARASSPTGPDMRDAISRGLARSATMRFGDEIVGGATGAMQGLANLLPASVARRIDVVQAPVADAYRAARNDYRTQEAAAQGAHPDAMRRAELGGDVAMMFAPGVAPAKGATLLRTMLKMGALGGATALGGSDADLTSGDPSAARRAAVETAVGTGVGLLTGAGGYGLEKVGGLVADKLAAKSGKVLSRALEKANQLGADKAAEQTATLRSEAGRAAQDAYKQLEHLRELNAGGMLSDEGRATAQQLEAELGQKAAEKLLPAAAKKAETGAAYADAVKTEAQRAADATAEALTPRAGRDAWELFKSYGEPVLGAAVGSVVGDQLGGHGGLGGALGTAGGLVFGRTRAGKALANRLAKPANQVLLSRALARLGRIAEGTGRLGAVTEEGAARTAPALEAAQSRALMVPAIADFVNGPKSQMDAYAQALRRKKVGDFNLEDGTP